LKIKRILVSQPAPTTEKSPYHEIADKHNVKIDFRSFIKIEGISAKEFRKYKINLLDFTAVIFTSKYAVDHFFRLSEELRVTIPETMKYFCTSESIAFYLQKYVVYRKRKIFYGENTFEDLMESILKHKDEKFLVPLSDIHKQDIPSKLKKAKIQFTKAVFYRTISSDLTDINIKDYDVLLFFSPGGIKSLFQNFPEFEQNGTKIGCFGPSTAKAVKDAGLRLDIPAPTTDTPSMTMALETFIKKNNKEAAKKSEE
jgi:uroporphyrinogen-III synthase